MTTAARQVLIKKVLAQNYQDAQELICEKMSESEGKVMATKDLAIWTLLEDGEVTHERYDKMRSTLATIWYLYDNLVMNVGADEVEFKVSLKPSQSIRSQIYQLIVSQRSFRAGIPKIRELMHDLRKTIIKGDDAEANIFFDSLHLPCVHIKRNIRTLYANFAEATVLLNGLKYRFTTKKVTSEAELEPFVDQLLDFLALDTCTSK